MARVMAVTRRVEVLGHHGPEVRSLFESSEHVMKVPYEPDVYAVTFGGEQGESDGCDEEGGGARPSWTRSGSPSSRAVNMG
jgi:hypothetical protein